MYSWNAQFIEWAKGKYQWWNICNSPFAHRTRGPHGTIRVDGIGAPVGIVPVKIHDGFYFDECHELSKEMKKYKRRNPITPLLNYMKAPRKTRQKNA